MPSLKSLTKVSGRIRSDQPTKHRDKADSEIMGKKFKGGLLTVLGSIIFTQSIRLNTKTSKADKRSQ